MLGDGDLQHPHDHPVSQLNMTNCNTLHVFPRKSSRWDRGDKQYLYDVNGLEYLDGINGKTAHVGHCHAQVVNAVQNQMAKLGTMRGVSNSEHYVNRITSYLPERLSVSYLCNSGSEANDLALRLARRYTGAEDVVVISGCYYGGTCSLVDISPLLFSGKKLPKDFVHVVKPPDEYRGKYSEISDPDTRGELYARDIRLQIKEDIIARGKKLAAFIYEPFFSNCGIHIPSKTFYKELFRTIREFGGLVIADEICSGFGRIGTHFWSYELFDLTPDIVTAGSSMGNGLPMGAVFCSREISDKLGYYYSTCGGNLVSCAAASSVLDVIVNEKLMSSAKNVGKVLEDGLKMLMDKYPNNVGDIRGQGLLWAIEIVSDRISKTPDSSLTKKIMDGLASKQVLINVGGNYENILLFSPPMCFNIENSQRFIRSLDDVLNFSLSLIRTLERSVKRVADEEEEDLFEFKRVKLEMEKFEELD
uniref:Ethanolaminephosphate phospholyaselike [Aplysia californica] n=1 Tax=Lepeophtheirus salmonis TaxID=72036 RepID=A0A0K2UZV5_LEPSM